MKYMLLFIKDENEVLDEAGLKARYAAIDDLVRRARSRRQAARRRGVAAVEAQQRPSAGRTGHPLVTDGPFMESKENVAGFVTIDVTDLDEAIAIAKKWPVKDQTVEIRPVIAPRRHAQPSGRLTLSESWDSP